MLRENEFAARHGVSSERIAYLTRVGLLKPARRNHQNLYGIRSDLRMPAIKKAEELGFTVAEIKQLLEQASRGFSFRMS